MKKPHIIYLLSDEHRGQAMAHSGDPNIDTPSMDLLATNGSSFSRAYANCPICTPSRGTIFSGRHAHAGPVNGFFDVFKPTAPSIATELRKLGYRTAYFGKWHCGIVRNQIPDVVTNDNSGKFSGGSRNRTPEYFRAGFQDWYVFENLNQHFNSSVYELNNRNPTPLKGYETDALFDMAIEYIDKYEREEPLFLVLSVTPPHFPLIVPEKWQRFNPEDLIVRENFSDTYEMREHLACYYSMIENLDWNIGRFISRLHRFSSPEEVLTVYFSDHGDYMGSHGLFNQKEHGHEESVRIPAIFHWPGTIPATGNREELFSLVDLMGTTLGLLGVDKPSWSQGVDFSDALLGNKFVQPQEVFLEMVGSPRWDLGMPDWRGLVTKRWKYWFNEHRVELLFDLENDPFELENLAGTHLKSLKEMRLRLLRLLKKTRDPYWDVLIEYGVDPEVPLDVSAIPGRQPYWLGEMAGVRKYKLDLDL